MYRQSEKIIFINNIDYNYVNQSSKLGILLKISIYAIFNFKGTYYYECIYDNYKYLFIYAQ